MAAGTEGATATVAEGALAAEEGATVVEEEDASVVVAAATAAGEATRSGERAWGEKNEWGVPLLTACIGKPP